MKKLPLLGLGVIGLVGIAPLSSTAQDSFMERVSAQHKTCAQKNFKSHGHTHNSRLEVTYLDRKRTPDYNRQSYLRSQLPWQNFLSQNGQWWVQFNEDNGKPQRAMGKPIPTYGASFKERAENFIANQLSEFNIPIAELEYTGESLTEKHAYVRFKQKHAGMEVLWSEMVVKMLQTGEVIMFGSNVYNNITTDPITNISIAVAENKAKQDVVLNNLTVTTNPDLFLLPTPDNNSVKMKLVYEIRVMGEDDHGVPSKFYCLVDAHNGDLLYRTDLVSHAVELDVTGDLHLENSYTPVTSEMLANMDVIVNGNAYKTDANGHVLTTETGPTTATFTLSGDWSTVLTNGTTPSFTMSVNDGANAIDFTGNATTQELSAYYHVNQIHDHMKGWMPSFTGMDFSLPTNVDLTTGTCNAFYNGSSINFYADGGGCNTYANVADVVYHEYGHGINDNFYQDNGSFFQNGAMGEGYADFWALSLTLNPILGVGGDQVDQTAFIRRYDQDPKVYPDDIAGQVHNDGEIICGAWWDTHLLMGGNINNIMPLWVDAYAGLQAATANGNEGTAYTNVLIDVLQADDNDGDITNGTPNGNEIVEGFKMHGIYLISNATIDHTDLLAEQENTGIDITADLNLNFPYTQYLGGVKMAYSLNNSNTWDTLVMTNTSGNVYDATIPAQPQGTIVNYFIFADDFYGNIAVVDPIASAVPVYRNLTHQILVGYYLEGTDDVADASQDFGNWTVGLPTDNATTGEWEIAIPLGSYSDPADPSTIVQTNEDHTAVGDICFVTGNANTTSDGIGTNDVDAGVTTLESPIIDLTSYVNPAFSYWRWYTNNPPSGANPNADWWQVQVSDDGGATWVYVENNLNGQRAWRRNAFRVADYVNVTSQFQMRFMASDSLRPGQNLDGGSLVEAALDDIQLWEEGVLSIEDNSVFTAVELYPNPAHENVKLNVTSLVAENASVKVFNAEGKLVKELSIKLLIGENTLDFNVDDLSSGLYNLTVSIGDDIKHLKLSVE